MLAAPSWRTVALGSLVALVVPLVVVLWWAGRPPRPDLPLPSGADVTEVRGNCLEGSELFQCAEAEGPRSFLELRTPRDRPALQLVVGALLEDGWREDPRGRIARDHSAAEPRRRQAHPVFCKAGEGCVGVLSSGPGRISLGWWRA